MPPAVTQTFCPSGVAKPAKSIWSADGAVLLNEKAGVIAVAGQVPVVPVEIWKVEVPEAAEVVTCQPQM